MEVLLIDRSFQPPLAAALRVHRRDVVLALTRHLQARFPQGGDHPGTVRDNPGLDVLFQVVGNEPPRLFLCRQSRPQLGGLDVGPIAGLHVPRPLGIVRAAPAVLMVLPVSQSVKRLLPSGGRDIEALAGLQIHPRRQNMHVDATARFAVLDGRPGVAIRFKPGPGGFLELVHHAADLRGARGVLRRPGDDARGVLVLELQRVGHGGHLVRVAAQNLHFFPVLFLVLFPLLGGGTQLAGEVVRRCRR